MMLNFRCEHCGEPGGLHTTLCNEMRATEPAQRSEPALGAKRIGELNDEYEAAIEAMKPAPPKPSEFRKANPGLSNSELAMKFAMQAPPKPREWVFWRAGNSVNWTGPVIRDGDHMIEHSAFEAVQKEREELLALHRQATRFVVPGEVDTSDAYFRIIAELKKERDVLAAELEQERLIVAEEKKWRKELAAELTSLRELGAPDPDRMAAMCNEIIGLRADRDEWLTLANETLRAFMAFKQSKGGGE